MCRGQVGMRQELITAYAMAMEKEALPDEGVVGEDPVKSRQICADGRGTSGKAGSRERRPRSLWRLSDMNWKPGGGKKWDFV